LLASFIVIPVALLIQGESALMFWGTNDVLWLAVIGVGIMSGLIIRLGIVHFKRENLLGREIDMLNLGWVWKTFWVALTGSDKPFGFTRYLRSEWMRRRGKEAETVSLREALLQDWNGLLRWYREDVVMALKRVAPSFWITLVIGVASVLVAYFYMDANLPNTVYHDQKLGETLKSIKSFLMDNDSGESLTALLFWHNLRAELIIMVLGVFSFGVLSIVAFIGNFALIGGVLATVRLVGLSPWLVFASGVLPHGIVELPSVILLSAVVLHMGLRLVTPQEGRSIGETMIVTFADVVKVFIAVCIPLLVIAALIEANITPAILQSVVGRSLGL
jgi:stage II sporulation protein M